MLHVNDPSGTRLDTGGQPVAPNDPGSHFADRLSVMTMAPDDFKAHAASLHDGVLLTVDMR